MKHLISVIQADFQRDGVTARKFFIYGVVAPSIVVAVCLLAEFINQL